MTMKSFFFIIFVLLNSACSYKILVKRENVIYSKAGYSILIDGNIYFIESRNPELSLDKILNKIDENTFAIGNLNPSRINALKQVSIPIQISMNDPFVTTESYIDTLYFAYMNLRGNPTARTFEQVKSTDKYCSFLHNGVNYKIYYHFFTYELSSFLPVDKNLQIQYVNYLTNFK